MDEASADASPIKLSLVVVTHNSEQALRESLSSWRNSLSDFRSKGLGACELVAVDNASTDQSREIVREFDGETKVISLIENRGFAAGCNAGAEASKGEVLLFLNPDVILDPNAISELFEALNSLENAGAVTARMRNSDGTFQPTCRNFPSAKNIFASRGSLIGRLFAGVEYTLPDSPRPLEVPAAAATSLVIRKKFFSELGGFDERFFMFFEDTDLSLRIKRAGKKIYFTPTAGGIHHWGRGAKATSSQRARWHHRSARRYFQKYHPGFFTSVILPIALTCNLALISLTAPFRDK